MTGMVIWCVLALLAYVAVQRLPDGFGWHILDLTSGRYVAEWRWVNFVGVLAPACATLGALIAWLRMRRLRRLT